MSVQEEPDGDRRFNGVLTIDMNTRKGQYYVVKPIALIMTIVILLMMFIYYENFGMATKQDAASIEMITDTSNTISILTNSMDCIAYNPLDLGIYGSIVSVERLDEFSQKYNYVEPECARDYVFGWHAVVEDLVNGDKWEFGAEEYTRTVIARVSEKSKITSMPIAIRHSAAEVNPGRITVTTYYGEFERLLGFIDHACMAGKRNNKDFTDTGVFYIKLPIVSENGQICLALGSERICRDTYCETSFKDIDSDGKYSISAMYSPEENRVVVRW